MVYMVIFFVVWLGVGVAVGVLIASSAPSGPGLHRPFAADAATGAVIAAVLALAAMAFSWTSGARLVLRVSGAVPADPSRFRQVHDLVEALAIGEGMPKPSVYVIDDPSPNAFATGISPDRAAVTVTTGLVASMNREELEGVLAHEMSHIRNYDVRLLLIISTLIGLAGLLASVLWRSAFFVRGGRGREGGQFTIFVLATTVLLGVIALVVGPLIRLALSRRREELADVSGVELTRNPAGLISALRKLEQNDQPFAGFNHATAPMCIDDPLQHHEGWMHRLFDTHPPISERIAVLERISEGRLV